MDEQINQHTELFFDDFTSPELDRSKWNVEVTGQITNNEQQAYVDSPETIYLEKGDESANGILVIQPRFSQEHRTSRGDVFDLVSGRINTRSKFEFKHAIVSARMRLPVGEGLWPAFWLLGTSGKWPECGEVDIMESVGEPDWVSVALHGPGFYGETALVNKKYFARGHDITQWHVYAVQWLENGIVFEIDGELVYRVTHPMARFFGSWAFDNQKFIILNLALGGTYPFKTNGIRSPYYGISDATIRTIQNNAVKFMVDWVRVTRS